MGDQLRVLLVEDDESDAELVRLELERGGFDLDWDRVDTEPRFKEALAAHWDLILSDFSMPNFSGLVAFNIHKRMGADIPFIFVSGALGEDRAVEAMRSGAKDYFLKGDLTRLSVAVKRELKEAGHRKERRRDEEKTLRENRRLELAIRVSNAGIFELGIEKGVVDLSGAWETLVGYAVDELPSDTGALRPWLAGHLHPDDQASAESSLAGFLAGQEDHGTTEFRVRHQKGRWVPVSASANVLERGPGGAPEHVIGALLDLSARKQLEAELRQAQKMEAIGQLAGGVAHDFNNLLTAIMSFGEFALESLPPENSATADLEEVLEAAKQAQGLTAQVLAISRCKPVLARVLNVNDVVASVEKILRRLLGADIDLVTSPAADLQNAKIDPDELEQVLLNLAVNARDAMPDGGALTIETDNVYLDEDYGGAHGAEVRAQDYVVVSVSDTGIGMDAATQANIFEPFFTTKEPGLGTGLGLSTCYGIVKQAEGFIWVYSEIGRGTTVKVYLPRAASPTDRIAALAEPSDLRGSETIMLVDDSAQVRTLATRALSRLGYKVVESINGEDALRQLLSFPTSVDLLITDVVMPVLGGKELVERVRTIRPSLPVLFTSGYAASAITHQGIVDTGIPILQKPFTPRILARRVRQILDDAKAAQL